jgi:signal transduction histidine kinase
MEILGRSRMSPVALRPTLTRQLVVPLAVFSAALALAALLLGGWQMNRQLEAQLLGRAQTIARVVRFSGESADSREEMSRLAHTLVAGGDVEWLAIAGMNPMRLMVASRADWQGRALRELSPGEADPRALQALERREDFSLLDRPAAKFYYVAPLGVNRPPPLVDAHLVIVLGTRALQEQIFAALVRNLAGLAALATLAVGGFALLLRTRIHEPLSRLAASFGHSRPPFNLPPPPASVAREIAALGDALTSAFGQVHELNQALESRVRDRTAELVASLDRERELGRLKTNFIGMVSHEYRNALGTILSSAQILRRYRERLDAAENARHVRQIEASCARLANLVEDVLLYSRSESGRLQPQPAPLDLPAVCRAAALDAAQTTGADPTLVPLDAAAWHGEAVSDESLLHHVLTNLLANAIKYSGGDQPVAFHLRRDGDSAIITIRDHGIGIAPDDLPRLGEAFWRGDNAARIPGTGLGLVMVRRCLDLLGGRWELASTPGQGTTVTVTLPLLPTAPSTDFTA